MEKNSRIEIYISNSKKYHFNILSPIREVLLTSEGFSSLQELKYHLPNLINSLKNMDSYILKESKKDNNEYYYYIVTIAGKEIFKSQKFATRKSAANSINKLLHNLEGLQNTDAINYIPEQINKTNINKVGSISTLINELTRLISHDEYVYFFRGHANHEFKMIPGIYRKESWIRSEFNFFKEIRLKCPDEFNQGTTAFQSLVKMQHYSLPTRLLDLTSNVLIALYFATELTVGKESDGHIIVLKVHKKEIKYYDDPKVSILSNISRIESDINKKENTSNNIINKQLKHFAQLDGAYLNK